MGNSSSRNRTRGNIVHRERTASIQCVSSTPEKKLAPTDLIEESDECRDAECPICFLNFSALNSLICCKQSICTTCYKQLSSNKECSCPFCGRKSFTAEYKPCTPLYRARQSTISTMSVSSEQSNSSPTDLLRQSSNGSGYHSSETNRSALKLRSVSVDSTSLVTTSSKSDREALEERIRNQRFRLIEEEFNSIPSGVARITPAATSRNPTNNRTNNSTVSTSRYQFGRARSIAVTNTSVQQSPMRVTAPRREVNHQDERMEDESDRFISSIHSLLQAQQMDQVSSLEQLEELMLMEAIRLSVVDLDLNPDVRTDVSETSIVTTSSPDQTSQPPQEAPLQETEPKLRADDISISTATTEAAGMSSNLSASDMSSIDEHSSWKSFAQRNESRAHIMQMSPYEADREDEEGIETAPRGHQESESKTQC